MLHYKRLTIFFFLIIVLASLSACSNTEGVPINVVTFELDGVTWESSNATAAVSQGSNLFTLQLSARNDEDELIIIEILSFSSQSIGTFVFDSGGNNQMTWAPSGSVDATSFNSSLCSFNDGQVTISQLDDFEITGTFQGVVCGATGQRTISNGRFLNVFLQ
ncbi:MAG: DUF6252 family protein [Bacteroidota bacterium]